jgi:hypothetical protein
MADPTTDTNVTSPPPAPIATQDATTTATVPQEQQPSYQQPAAQPTQAAPPPVQMTKSHSGIVDILDDLADALAGRNREVVSRDPDSGKRIVTNQPQSRGQQWREIAGRAVTGAAAAGAQPSGPNSKVRGLSAGIQAGAAQADAQKKQQEALSDEDFKTQQQTKINNANLALSGATLSGKVFELTRAKVKALQEDAQAENTVTQQIRDAGGTDLGVVNDGNDLPALLKSAPNAVKDHVNGNLFHVPHINEDGTYGGMRYFVVPPDWKNAKTDVPHTFDQLTPSEKPGGVPTVSQFTVPAGALTNGEAMAMDQVQRDKIAKYQVEQKRAADEAKLHKSEESRNYAEAYKASTEAKLAASAGAADTTGARLVEGLEDPSQLSKRSKDYDAKINAANEYSMKTYGKPWDMATAAANYGARKSLIKDLDTGILGTQIRTFNTFLGHADDFNDSIVQLRNTKSPLLNKPINELRKASGNPAVAAILPKIENVRTEYQNFLNNNHALKLGNIAEGNTMLNENMSPAQMQEAVKSFTKAAITRVGTINDQSVRVMKQPVPGLLNRISQQAIQKMGLQDHLQNVLNPDQPPPNEVRMYQGHPYVSKGGQWILQQPQQ